MSLGVSKPNPYTKIEGSKPCIYTFYTKTRQIPYKNTRLTYLSEFVEEIVHSYKIMNEKLVEKVTENKGLLKQIYQLSRENNELINQVNSLKSGIRDGKRVSPTHFVSAHSGRMANGLGHFGPFLFGPPIREPNQCNLKKSYRKY